MCSGAFKKKKGIVVGKTKSACRVPMPHHGCLCTKQWSGLGVAGQGGGTQGPL